MKNMKFFIIAFGLILIGLIAQSSAGPIKKKLTHSQRVRSGFRLPFKKRQADSCIEALGHDVDFTKFADEIAIEYLNSGNEEELDETLHYLVEINCFTKKETNEFRNVLKTILNLMNDESHKVQINELDLAKRSETQHENGHDYFKDLNVFLDKILSQSKIDDKKTEEILTYISDHIKYLEQTHMLTKNEADGLLNRVQHHSDSANNISPEIL